MANLDMLGSVVSFFTLIQYTTGVTDAQDEIRIHHDIIEGATTCLSRVRADLQRFGDSLPDSRRSEYQADIERAGEALKKARRVLGTIDANTGITRRGIRGVRWVLKDRAATQVCQALVNQCHSTLLAIRMQLALQGHKRTWSADHFSVEPRMLSYPRIGSFGDSTDTHPRFGSIENGYSNSNPYAYPHHQQELLDMAPLVCKASPLVSPRNTKRNNTGLWLLEKSREDSFRRY
ncbi:hypothetical protein FQN52_005080 [Onygenales sp. PD_12]|nr:hypothetical protein FQN52_005080 [Onygenales sp. PD_12]